MSKINKALNNLLLLLHQHPLKVLALVFTVGSLSILLHIKSLNLQLIESTTTQSTRQYAQMLNQFRTLYTSEVVNTIAKMGIEVTHDYHQKEHAIPLPATLSLLLGERMGLDGLEVKTRLYSAYPFPWRQKTGGLTSKFEQDAWQQLNITPDQPFVRIEKVDDILSVRYAIADVMRPECIDCHNTHPDTPKVGWKVGDVRGILEVSEPLAAGISQVNNIFMQMAAMIAILLLIAMTAFTLTIRRLTLNNITLDKLNVRLSDEIVERKQTEVALNEAKDKAFIAKEQAELAKAEAVAANKAKSFFLANISHEIRTPMNAILGYTQILQRDQTLNADQQHSLSIVGKSGEHLLGLIDDVLDLSKIEAGATPLAKVPFDLVELCNTLSDMFKLKAEQKGISWNIAADFVVEKLIVCGDQGKIRQVLINLVANAIKFTEQGFVNFMVTCKADDVFTFEIIDSGIGIAKKDQQVIFDAFNQGQVSAEMGGTGLGLAISKKYLSLMSSTLKLKSEPNKGSHFYFDLTLPVVKNAIETEATPFIEQLTSGQHKHLLVIDDIELNRTVLCRMLSDVGFTVSGAADGEVALTLMKTEHFDLVFTDLMMPNMDGETFLKHAKKLRPDLPIVAISASSLQIEQEYYLEKGFVSYISKPFHFDDIYRMLHSILGVQFDYRIADKSKSKANKTTTEENFQLSPDKVTQLLQQIELYRISEIEKLLQQFALDSPGNDGYFAQLKTFIDNYDMDGLKAFLTSSQDE